jgi:hypothetical protein
MVRGKVRFRVTCMVIVKFSVMVRVSISVKFRIVTDSVWLGVVFVDLVTVRIKFWFMSRVELGSDYV